MVDPWEKFKFLPSYTYEVIARSVYDRGILETASKILIKLLTWSLFTTCTWAWPSSFAMVDSSENTTCINTGLKIRRRAPKELNGTNWVTSRLHTRWKFALELMSDVLHINIFFWLYSWKYSYKHVINPNNYMNYQDTLNKF